MHERPLYYVFALFVALMLVTLVSPAFGDGDVNVEGTVSYSIYANGGDRAFVNVSSPSVSVNFTAITDVGSLYQPDWYNWTVFDVGGNYVESGQIFYPQNWYNRTFTTPGKYSVRCMAYNGSHPQDFGIKEKPLGFVTAYLPISANFTNSTTTGVLPLGVNFFDNSNGGPDRFQWNLSDSSNPVTNKTDKNPTTTYQTNGTKIITLTVWNTTYASNNYCPDGNCEPIRSSISRPIIIDSREGIVSNFSTNITPAKGQVPLSVQFFNNSTYDYRDTLHFNWTFGDGGTNIIENPIHTYTNPGLYPVSLNVSGNWSYNNTTKERYVNAYLPISANFSSAPAGTCLHPVFPVTYNFTTNATKAGFSEPDKFNWSFNDGTPNATTRNTNHVFNLPGVYNVILTTLNTTHDISISELKQVQITGLYANFTADPLVGYQQTTGASVRVNFTANATDVASASYWAYDFGNGGGDIYPNSNTTYNRPGVYPVTFTVGNECGRNTTQMNITIIERPIANFSYQPSYGNFPLSVQFTDLTTDHPDQWLWNFGDGSVPVANVQNPVHIYNSPGTYRVEMTVRNTTVTPIWTYSIPIDIHLSEGFDTSFTSNTTRGVSPLTVQFNDTSIPSAPITNWSWNFGDNSPVSTQQNPVHTFYGANNYTVNLTVWNTTTGARGSAENTIEVVEPIYPDFMPNRTARMNISQGVQFTDLSIGNVSDWFWDFGDGNTSDQQNPVNIFPEFKEYLVNLTVYNWYYDDIESVNYTVNVTEMRAPLSDFSADPTTVNTQDFVYFTPHVQGPDIDSYLWDFGDGQTSNGTNPSHQYQLPGKYTVSLKVTNPFGEDTAVKTDYISVRGLIPSFITVPAEWAVVNTPVTFIDTSKGSPVSWHWDFGDGTIDNPTTGMTTHTYTAEDTYTVNLTVTNWQPMTASVTQQIRIVNKTVPQGVNFEVPELRYSGTHPFYVQFEDTTPAQANVVEWFWEFGDGSNSFEPAPNHTYMQPGQYTVTLTVRNDAGTNDKRRVAYVVVL